MVWFLMRFVCFFVFGSSVRGGQECTMRYPFSVADRQRAEISRVAPQFCRIIRLQTTTDTGSGNTGDGILVYVGSRFGDLIGFDIGRRKVRCFGFDWWTQGAKTGQDHTGEFMGSDGWWVGIANWWLHGGYLTG